MMWDLSGGRRSPQPSRGLTPSFPIPHLPLRSVPSSSNMPIIGSSYPPLPTFGNLQPPVATARSDSYGHGFASQSYEHYENYQTPRALNFPSTSNSTTYAPQPPIVIHHSSHHSKSKHSHHRERRHSHSGAKLPVPRPAVPQVPIYHSLAGTQLKSALVHHASSQHLGSSHHRPSQNSNSNHNHVSFQSPPSKKLTKPQVQVQSTTTHNPVHYSKCTGRRKALCIGINYTGQRNELRGCVNDAKRVRQFLIKHGYAPEDVILLTDDSTDPKALPTKKNILAGMRWLVRGAQRHDALFFHYSGHGGQTPDLDGDEVDGFDEVIYPLDFDKYGHIVDDEMHDIMVKPLPDDCRLTGLFDACHSGTVLDLPYVYSSHGRLKGSQITERARRKKATNADVISWSGCKDGQTSADTFQGGVAVGAMSHAFISSLTAKPNQTYQELLRSIRLILHPRYSQKPQLGSSHHIDTGLRFVF